MVVVVVVVVVEGEQIKKSLLLLVPGVQGLGGEGGGGGERPLDVAQNGREVAADVCMCALVYECIGVCVHWCMSVLVRVHECIDRYGDMC